MTFLAFVKFVMICLIIYWVGKLAYDALTALALLALRKVFPGREGKGGDNAGR